MSECCTAGVQVEDPKLIQLNEVLDQFSLQRGALIPVLQKAQNIYGYLPQEVIEHIAKRLRVPVAKVYGVVTFYAQFRLQPMGRNVVRVCMGTACHVRGGEKVLDEIKQKLGVNDGETTADLRYTLEMVACIGACGLAPVMSVNNVVHGRLTPDKVEEILESYQ